MAKQNADRPSLGIRVGRSVLMWPAAVIDMRVRHDPTKPYGTGVIDRHAMLANGEVWAMTKPLAGFVVAWRSAEPPW